ncbi:MAG: serine hydroxymethyltransferase, partial [Bacillota bacterium]|nr:serine hydroxymethyltransferase [Bacillota bacterium]
VSGGTDNHLMLVDLRSKNMTGKAAEALLDKIGITLNKNTVPMETESPFVTSGVRIGSAATTTRGFGKKEMEEIAEIISFAIDNRDGDLSSAEQKVREICARFPLYQK